MPSIDTDITIKGMDKLNKIIDELEKPTPINRAIKSAGEQAVGIIKRDVPKKTGRYSRSLIGKRKKNGKFYDYYIAPNTPHGHAIWGYSMYGTNPRFRTYKDKSKGVKFRQPAPTGSFKKNPAQLKSASRIQKIMVMKIRIELNKIGGK